jgi:uncharacterized OB-fold protein
MSDAPKPITSITTPVRLEYTIVAGSAQSRFLRNVAAGRLVGERCRVCTKVYVPPRGACPTCAVPTRDEVELGQRGTITTFCTVNIPFEGRVLELPYVAAAILLDGADIAIFHLIQEIPANDVRMGLRVEAVWAPPAERRPSLESILYFRPTGEPDAAYDTYKEHL